MIWRNTRFVTQRIYILSRIASEYGSVVFNERGWQHNGATPYADIAGCFAGLARVGQTLAVHYGFGKHRASYAVRIAKMGSDTSPSAQITTHCEVLWSQCYEENIPEIKFFITERLAGDAVSWGEGVFIDFSYLDYADAVFSMGLPYITTPSDLRAQLKLRVC